jgi:single-strand DNA-binding protein
MVNSVVLVGRLATDPQLRYTPTGKPVTRFVIAVDRRRKNGDGGNADFIPVLTWGKTAENVVQYISKGRLVALEGRISSRSAEVEGKTRRFVEIVAVRVRFLPDGRRSSAAQATEAGDEDLGHDDDLPVGNGEEEGGEDVPF